MRALCRAMSPPGWPRALCASLAALPDDAAFAGELVAPPPRPGRRIVDDSKVHDHHAIIPTGKSVRPDVLDRLRTPSGSAARPGVAGDCDRDAWRLFDLIARRFLAAFFPDAEFAVT